MVLPFKNRSDAPELGYLAEGFSSAVTIQLSKFPQLFIIAASTAHSFANTNTRPKDIGRELGVRYILDGTLQQGGSGLLLNASLVEAETEKTARAEQFSFESGEVFSTQADVVQEITSTLRVAIESSELAALRTRPTDSDGAFDLYLRAVAESETLQTADTLEAIALLKQSVTLDPDYLAAHLQLAGLYLSLWRFGRADDPEGALRLARLHTARALELDQKDYRSQHRLAQIHLFADHDHELAYQGFLRAVDGNPNDADILYGMGFLRSLMGEPTEAISWNTKAKRINPHYPAWYNFNAALSHFLIRDYDTALLLAKTGIAAYPKSLAPRRIMIAALSEAGRMEEAHAQVAEFMQIAPNFRLTTFRNTPFQHDADQNRYFDAMRAAGIPD